MLWLRLSFFILEAMHCESFQRISSIIQEMPELVQDCFSIVVNDGTVGGKNDLLFMNICAQYGCLELIKVILDTGDDANGINKCVNAALSGAIIGNQLEIVKVLLEERDADIEEHILIRCLDLFAKEGCLESIKMILDTGTDISRNGHSSLRLAAENGHSEIVKILLDNGVDINALSGRYGYTALHLAAYYGRSEIVKILLDNGDNVERKDARGFMALHIAASQDNLGTAKLLMKYLLIANLNASVPDLDDTNRQDWNNYKAELEKMKERDNDLYDFLVTKNIDEKVRILTGSKKVQQVVQQNRLTIEYPNYAEDLTSKIESMIFFLNNKEMINSLSKHYNKEIKTIHKTEILLNRFQRENPGYETKFFSPQLNYNTKELQIPTLKELSFAQRINDCARLPLEKGTNNSAITLKTIGAIAVSIVAVATVISVSYGMGKFSKEISEEKQENRDMSIYATIKSMLFGVSATQHPEPQFREL